MVELRGFCLSLALLSACLAGGPAVQDEIPALAASEQPEPAPSEEEPALRGLQLRLGEVTVSQEASLAEADAVMGLPLSPSERDLLLERLPALESGSGDQQPFSLPASSPPAPVAGQMLELSFPATGDAEAPPAVEPGALQVLRYAPEGEVPLAPHLSISFSQPMTDLSSQEQAAQQVPLRLEPEPPGQWRWVGTRTLLFEPEGRFPMATEYQVRSLRRVRSALGEVLEAPLSWSFATPALQLESSHPQGLQGDRPPLLQLVFDQRVDAAALLPLLRLESRGPTGRAWSLRLASPQEIAADEEVARLAGQAEAGRQLVLRPLQELPRDTAFQLVLSVGSPSAEGPRLTAEDQSFRFRTYAPLAVEEQRCGGRGSCSPDDDFVVIFNNVLAEEQDLASMLGVAPEVPGLQLLAQRDRLRLSGLKQGRCRYKLTLPAELQDVYGQTLGSEQVLVFETGQAEPLLLGPEESFVVLDPLAAPALTLHSRNHERLDVLLHSVRPQDWGSFASWMQRRRRYGEPEGSPPGRLLWQGELEVQGEPDTLVESTLDLAPHLEEGHGQLVVLVRPQGAVKDARYQEVLAWVQATQIGLTALHDQRELVVMASDLSDGSALEGLRLELWPSRARRSSDAQGMARWRLPLEAEGAGLVVARRGSDLAILPRSASWWSASNPWTARAEKDRVAWLVFDDRGLYQPGESVRIKGWLRRRQAGRGGDLLLLGGRRSLRWKLRDSRGNQLATGRASLSALGGFDLELQLPEAVELGTAWLELELRGTGLERSEYRHGIRIEQFRRPEYEVQVQADPGPWHLGEQAIFSAQASYYAGGGLAAAPVRWQVDSGPASYAPPGHQDYHFGRWRPRWYFGPWQEREPETSSQVFSAFTDAEGRHQLQADFLALRPAMPVRVEAEATVTDLNRQAWSASKSLLVHPGQLYVGIRVPRRFVQPGDALRVQAIVSDVEGALQAGRKVEMSLVRQDWRRQEGRWQQADGQRRSCQLESAAQAQDCVFEELDPGTWRLRAQVRDDLDRPNASETLLWVAGGALRGEGGSERQQLVLIPDREEHAPGDVAEIMVQSPFFPAEGLLSLRRSGLVETRRLVLEGPTTTLQVPIEEQHLPNLLLSVQLLGQQARLDERGAPRSDLPPQPAYASGTLDLAVSTAPRTLQLELSPERSELEPGARSKVDLVVRDEAGAPVAGAEVALVVADEALLALSGHGIPDPMDVFYSRRAPGVSEYELRQHLLVSDVSRLLGGLGDLGRGGSTRRAASAPMGLPMARAMLAAPPDEAMAMADGGDDDGGRDGGEDGGESSAAGLTLRSDFDALALFAPQERSDEQGQVSVDLQLPDSLTRYRVMAVAVDGGQRFGSAETSITARKPLMLRPSPPRFLNFGDRAQLCLLLQNQTAEPLPAQVVLRAANAVLDEEGPEPAVIGRRLQIPARDRVELRFAVAALSAGTARFQAAVAAGELSDAAGFALPVHTPATVEAFATYGELDEGAVVQPVQLPQDVRTQFGGLELSTSSSALQALSDAVLYLADYPYSCVEQASSRLLAVAALRDVLGAFSAQGLPDPEALEQAVSQDLQLLAARQNNDGGFGFWRRGERSWPFVSVHAAHALARARAKGLPVPELTMSRALRYLRGLRRKLPDDMPEQVRCTVEAYALHVRHLAGDSDGKRARSLLRQAGVEDLSLEALAWLLPVLAASGAEDEVAQLLRQLENRVSETAATAQFVQRYEDGAHLLLHSDRRSDALLLEALIASAPQHELIPKLCRGLLAHRRQGRWNNTQENAFALLAMDRYFHAYEAQEPEFVARAWLGSGLVAEQSFQGRGSERAQLLLPMDWLAQAEESSPLILAKEGPGRLYYRLGLRYAPLELGLEPAERGFAVQRSYEGVDDEGDVWLDEAGSWHVRAGARVRVRLTMVTPARRYHVALVDPLPAGLEPLNPSLAATGQLPADATEPSSPYWWWTRSWYEHQNLRDERIEAFASLLREGVHRYSYVARATTLGRFVVPPPRAEEMYHPETFGRGGSDVLIVEP